MLIRIAALFLSMFAGLTTADPTTLPFLHPLFSDGMVLQRDARARIEGWTTPGAKVVVAIKGTKVEAFADATGRWQTLVGPFPAGAPATTTVGGPTTVTVQDVQLGDVWLCSGQSNMELPPETTLAADFRGRGEQRPAMFHTGSSSLRNGAAGRPAALIRLQPEGLSAQA